MWYLGAFSKKQKDLKVSVKHFFAVLKKLITLEAAKLMARILARRFSKMLKILKVRHISYDTVFGASVVNYFGEELELLVSRLGQQVRIGYL